MRLRQILVNLISNAIKFTSQGGITVTGKSTPCSLPNQYKLQFDVQDTGIGIPHSKLNSLFKPFSQIDSSLSRKYNGTGLGLGMSN